MCNTPSKYYFMIYIESPSRTFSIKQPNILCIFLANFELTYCIMVRFRTGLWCFSFRKITIVKLCIIAIWRGWWYTIWICRQTCWVFLSVLNMFANRNLYWFECSCLNKRLLIRKNFQPFVFNWNFQTILEKSNLRFVRRIQ